MEKGMRKGETGRREGGRRRRGLKNMFLEYSRIIK